MVRSLPCKSTARLHFVSSGGIPPRHHRDKLPWCKYGVRDDHIFILCLRLNYIRTMGKLRESIQDFLRRSAHLTRALIIIVSGYR